MDTGAQEAAVVFLQSVPPFQLLEEAVLRRVAACAEVHRFPKGARILERGGQASKYLYVVVTGAIKMALRTDGGDEVLVDVAGRGKLVGVLSVVERDVSRGDAVALEDSTCYAIPYSIIEDLLTTNPAFARYFLHFAVRRYVDWSLDRIGGGNPLWNSENFLSMGSRARDLARVPIVNCREFDSAREAAQKMSISRISSVVVVDDVGRAIGIVTDWDLRERVVAAGRSADIAVREIMSHPPIMISGDEPVFEAVRIMIQRNIHHLIVVEDGRPLGMITGHDLIVLQGTSALYISREIDRQSDLAGLRRVLEQSQRLIPFLLKQGLRAGQIGRIVAEMNDRLVVRVVELTEAELGPPPVPYCWLVLGSEGRREQTFKTDQDNALLYADPPPGMAKMARQYFLELGRRVVAGLVEVGFPPCPGRCTADNPSWTQPLNGWYEHFHRWVAIPEPQAVVNSLIFFDFRGIYGDQSLAESLRGYVQRVMGNSRLFLMHMANLSTTQAPPLGFLGHFVVERSGEHKDQLDLKFKGTARIVDLARFFALRHNISETNTLVRLELLKQGNYLPAGMVDELSQSFEFIMNLRIRRQWEQTQAGRPLSNYINPKQLSPLDRSSLREAFQAISRAQADVREEYHSERITE